MPLDGSEEAERILSHVSHLARILSIPVTLVSVVTESESSETEGFTRRRYLESIQDRLAEQGVTADSIVSYGPRTAEIIRVAEREGCDLVAMATHARNILGRVLHGSVTERMIRFSHLPILSVGPQCVSQCCGGNGSWPRIILPLDKGPLAEAALPFGEHLARDLSLELVLVHVINTGGPSTGPLDSSRNVDVDRGVRGAALSYLGQVARELRIKGSAVDPMLLVGIPSDGIVGLTYSGPNIVVMSTHGRSGPSRLTEGSVTQDVIRLSASPVLIISRRVPVPSS